MEHCKGGGSMRVPSGYMNPDLQTDKEKKKREKKISEEKTGGRLPDFERINDGLYLLHGPDQPNVEIVFFHGLDSHGSKDLYKTAWMTSSGECWPAAWLPQEDGFSKARILTVKYDSSATKTGTSGMFSMRPLVETLATELIRLGSVGQKGIPLILVGHNLGGLVIKELCLHVAHSISLKSSEELLASELKIQYESFLKRVSGVFYFATPHQGVDVLATRVGQEGKILKGLKPLEGRTANSNNDFRLLRNDRKWKASGLGSANAGPQGSLNTKEASMRYDTDDFMMVNESTESIAKPVSRDTSNFRFFLMSVKEFVRAADWNTNEINFGVDNSLFSNTIGLESTVQKLLRQFLRQEKAGAGTSAVVIHGMGGIGKSTVGYILYEAMKARFDQYSRCQVERHAELKVSEAVVYLQRYLLTCFQKESTTDKKENFRRLEAYYNIVRVTGLPLLIFIDNIENEEELAYIFPQPISQIFPRGSRILLTTRNSTIQKALKNMDVPNLVLHEMEVLDGRLAETLFFHHFHGRGPEKLISQHVLHKNVSQIPVDRFPVPPEDVQKLIDLCDGLPLALEVVGKSLQRDDDEKMSSWRRRWDSSVDSLQKCSVPSSIGEKEDMLRRSLGLGFDRLNDEVKEVFIDIAFCFNESPWSRMEGLYGEKLNMLKRRALIKKTFRKDVDRGLEYEIVKVHALLVAMGRNMGSLSGSHFIHSVHENRIDFRNVFDHDQEASARAKKFVLVLRGSNRYVPQVVRRSSPMFGWVFSEPATPCALEKFSRSLRILILEGLQVEGNFCDVELDFPQQLNCLICHNSTVPFQNGDLRNLKDLKFLEINTNIDKKETYMFPSGLRSLRVQNPWISGLVFDSENELEEFTLMAGMSTNIRMHRRSRSSSRLPCLRKLIIANIGCLREFPDELFEMDALESLSIQDRFISALPEQIGRLKQLKHLHVSIPKLRELPESLSYLRGLEALTLENCFLLSKLRSSVLTLPRLKLVSVKDCPKLEGVTKSTDQLAYGKVQFQLQSGHSTGEDTDFPSGENGDLESAVQGSDLSLQASAANWPDTCIQLQENTWHLFCKGDMDSDLVEESLAATQMRPFLGDRLFSAPNLSLAQLPAKLRP